MMTKIARKLRKDGKLKNFIRKLVNLTHRRKHEKYVSDVRERAKGLGDFTLLTSDCIGGLIYHTLGRRFLSPTINLSIDDKDFLKLVSDLKYWLVRPLEFIQTSKSYPVAILAGGGQKDSNKF